MTEPSTQPPEGVSGRWVVAAMAMMSVAFVGGLIVVVPRVPNYDPKPGTILRQIATAQDRYRTQDPDGDGADYATLAELDTWSLVDPEVGRGTRAGYVFLVRPLRDDPDGWVGVANPVEPGESGTRYYGVDQRGVVFYTTAAPFSLAEPIPEAATELPLEDPQ